MAPEYADTRHNIGFMTGDTLAEEAGVPFQSKRYGDIAVIKVKNCELRIYWSWSTTSPSPSATCGCANVDLTQAITG